MSEPGRPPSRRTVLSEYASIAGIAFSVLTFILPMALAHLFAQAVAVVLLFAIFAGVPLFLVRATKASTLAGGGRTWRFADAVRGGSRVVLRLEAAFLAFALLWIGGTYVAGVYAEQQQYRDATQTLAADYREAISLVNTALADPGNRGTVPPQLLDQLAEALRAVAQHDLGTGSPAELERALSTGIPTSRLLVRVRDVTSSARRVRLYAWIYRRSPEPGEPECNGRTVCRDFREE